MLNKAGKVYIIGAGPGDAGLITVRAVEVLSLADVVVYDHLVNEELLKYASAACRCIYAGKQGGEHALPQDKINEMLVDEALAGRTVARLKGGDPFIFGRGGEEAEELAAADIPFEIIPGVTSAIAVPAYAGIPLTHRGLTSTVAFITGHEDPTKEKSDIDWKALAGIGTLVFLMGVKNIAQIAASLINQGKAADTPCALIRRGTTPEQESITGCLSDIALKAQAAKLSPPAILVVGSVVGLRQALCWFERKPLFGKGVVITRPESQTDDLARLLEKEGARAIRFPTVKIVPPQEGSALDAALGHLGDYDWLVFTSANGVRFFFVRLAELGKDIRELKSVKICCIGPATAEKIKEKGIKVDLVPEKFIAESVLQSFHAMDMKGQRVLIPRAAKARDILPAGLQKMGAAVDVVTAYETVNSGRKGKELHGLLAAGFVDVITFTSSSTVTNFLEIMGGGFHLPPQVKIACIGPVTADAAQQAGLPVDIRQDHYTMEGLVEALCSYFQREKPA